jgi:hypothetical protein
MSLTSEFNVFQADRQLLNTPFSIYGLSKLLNEVLLPRTATPTPTVALTGGHAEEV